MQQKLLVEQINISSDCSKVFSPNSVPILSRKCNEEREMEWQNFLEDDQKHLQKVTTRGRSKEFKSTEKESCHFFTLHFHELKQSDLLASFYRFVVKPQLNIIPHNFEISGVPPPSSVVPVRNNLKVEFDLRKAKTEIDSTDKKRREGRRRGRSRYELQITRSNEVNNNQNVFGENAFFLFLENFGFRLEVLKSMINF
jgi:hypothetical protein